MSAPALVIEGTYQPCNFGEQCSAACSDRAAHSDCLWPWIHDALVRAQELQQIERLDQLDLFSSSSDDLADFWWGIHRALGDEYRRREKQFWVDCPQRAQEPANAG